MSSDANKSEMKVFKVGEESLSDVIFVVGGNEFHCNGTKDEERIEIKETDAVAFKRFMQILYDSHIEDKFLPKCLDVTTVDQSLKLWTDTCALFELADRFLVLDVVRHVVEMHFLIHSFRCPYKKDCGHCAMKLILALRYKMTEYNEMMAFTRKAVDTVIAHLMTIETAIICDLQGIEYLMKLV